MKKIIAIIPVLVAAAIFLCYTNSSSAQETFFADLNNFYALVNGLHEKSLLDGEVLVTQGDVILFHRQSAYIQASAHNPQFLIASISKHFTAVALLQALYDSSPGLNEAEKCAHVLQQLQEPIITFLPPERFAWGATIPKWAHHITLHHLLSHTSGMVQHVRLMFERVGFEGVDRYLRRPHSAAEIIQQFGHEPLQFAPGSGYSYSNLGYELLAQVISGIANMPYSEYLKEKIFAPCSMHSTCNPTEGSSYYLKQLPSCSQLVSEMFYDATSEDQEPSNPAFDTLNDIGSAQGSGGIISTAHDLWHWNRALHEFKTVLPAPLYDLLIQPKFDFNQHAYGVWNRNGIMHTTGRYGAYTSQLIYIPQHNVSIVMLCHVSRDEAIMHKKYVELERELAKTILDNNELQKHVREILETRYPLKRGSVQVGDCLFKLVDSIDLR